MNMSEQNTIKDGGEPNILSRILGWVSHRFLPRTAASGLFMDALSCLLLSAATLAFLLAPTGLKNALPIHFAASAVLSCLIALVSRRWWIFPCAAGGGVLIYAAVHLIAGSLPGQIEYWGGFIDWAASGAAVEPGVTDLSFPVVLYVLAALAVTAVMFVLIRTLFSLSSIVFGLLAALQIGAFILSCVLVYSDLTGAVCVSAAGMIMLLPRVYAKRLAGTAKRGGVSRSHMQAVAVFTATLSVIIALIITPKDTGVWQSRRLNYWLYDLNTLAGDPLRIWRTTGNESSSDFGLRRVTFQSETGRLGGPITLDDELYLIVTSSRPVLLRGQVKDQYTGRSWRASVGRTEDYRLASPLWNDLRRETFDQNKPIGGEEARGIYRRLTAEVEVTARKTSNTSNVLFVPGSMQTAALRNSSATEILFNKRSELYLPAFLPNMRYTVTSRVWNIGTPNFEELFLRLEELVCRENEGYSDKSYPAIAERYTQLPEGLPPEVRAAADDITKGIDSPFLKARAISRWLAANAEYTLTPDMPPDGEDFVAHFLETREGYCVYYASAMAVLARCADLPARYVTGFALKYDAESGDYHATGKTAHAWSEVYFEGIGWFPIDPLGWNSQAPLNEDAPSDVSASAL
ncbi:MAG: transglutaminase-like domain-containing protein, partial [Oscillospiraceae bacterium]|nr:transglutaminase-like domain-containing protein [Oscillospiraceae bacterium]